MSKFTPLSELEEKMDSTNSTSEIVPDEDYESDVSELVPERKSRPPPSRAPRSIMKEPSSFEKEPQNKGSALRDVLVCAVAFALVANPFTIKKLLGIEAFSSKTLIGTSDYDEKIFSSNVNWKGFGAQVLSFLVIIIVFKLLSYFGIF